MGETVKVELDATLATLRRSLDGAWKLPGCLGQGDVALKRQFGLTFRVTGTARRMFDGGITKS